MGEILVNVGVVVHFFQFEGFREKRKFSRRTWPRGPTDKASDYESGDSRFESWRGRFFRIMLSYCYANLYH